MSERLQVLAEVCGLQLPLSLPKEPIDMAKEKVVKTELEKEDWRKKNGVPVCKAERIEWIERIKSRRILGYRPEKSKENYKSEVKRLIEELESTKDNGRRSILITTLRQHRIYYVLDGHVDSDNQLEDFLGIFGNYSIRDKIKRSLGVAELTGNDVIDYHFAAYEFSLNNQKISAERRKRKVSEVFRGEGEIFVNKK